MLAQNSTFYSSFPNSNCGKWVMLTSYPPRQCGIATFSYDLVRAIEGHFEDCLAIEIAALETESDYHHYSDDHVNYILRTDSAASYAQLAQELNKDPHVDGLIVQHEFGLFHGQEEALVKMLRELEIPKLLNFHTVLPNPGEYHMRQVHALAEVVDTLIVMTEDAKRLLIEHYHLPELKIELIPHGTHRINANDRSAAKHALGLADRTVMATFGLISEGKSIETTLQALPAIVSCTPNVLFLIIGKTHPTVALREGERYREKLVQMVRELQLEDHVHFVNEFVTIQDLKDYLLATDIYLFTSKDKNQAVSGTFMYALSAGCAVVSTPIPHAKQYIQKGAVLPFEFENPQALATTINQVLFDVELREQTRTNALHCIADSAWDNVALKWSNVFQKNRRGNWMLNYRIPAISLQHLRTMTTDFGMLQFCKFEIPDIASGYTLDDNARALIVVTEQLQRKSSVQIMPYIERYLNFIQYCQRPNDWFINYVDINRNYTMQNTTCNLQDATGRAIWSIGHLLAHSNYLTETIRILANHLMTESLALIERMDSPRAMSFALKGLYYYLSHTEDLVAKQLAATIGNRLVDLYRINRKDDWHWFEPYMTYANTVLPEAVLCAYQITNDELFREVALESFDFVLSILFDNENIKVISNQSWLQIGQEPHPFGEQPIDVAYCIVALKRFYRETGVTAYLHKMRNAFTWFLGNNHLQQVMYNSETGGCYDGLEETHVNLNQGAESTLCYLMARHAIKDYFKQPLANGLESPYERLLATRKLIAVKKSR